MSKYKLNIGDKLVDASIYQDRIFDFVEYGVGNMIINASAGSGKTSTIINCMNIIPPDKKVLFIAFNKSTVENIRNHIGDRKNTRISTFHSLGKAIYAENYGKLRDGQVSEFKYRNYIKANVDQLSSSVSRMNKNERSQFISSVTDLSYYCRCYLAFSLKEIAAIADKYSIVPLSDEFDVVNKVLKWGKNNVKTIDYEDMIWLPNVLNYNTKWYRYDWILIDEAQDTSVAEQKLVEKCYGRGVRICAVGDRMQTINTWAGSDNIAIDNFKKLPNTREFSLPISYRCPKKIVSLAKRYSSNIEAAENAIEGEINYNILKGTPTSGDMVLCRISSPLVELHLYYMRINKKSFLIGSDKIREQYLSYIEATDAKEIGSYDKNDGGLISCLYKELLERVKNVREKYGLDAEDAMVHDSVISFYDTIEAIKAIGEGLDTVDQLKEKINIIFGGDNKDAVLLSTVHKAKGMEADNVYILYPSLMPWVVARKQWEKEAENNLIYVAVTRAKKTLNYIAEEGKRGKDRIGRFNLKSIRDTIGGLSILYGVNIFYEPTKKDNILSPIGKTQKLGEEHISHGKPKNNGGLRFSKIMV